MMKKLLKLKKSTPLRKRKDVKKLKLTDAIKEQLEAERIKREQEEAERKRIEEEQKRVADIMNRQRMPSPLKEYRHNIHR